MGSSGWPRAEWAVGGGASPSSSRRIVVLVALSGLAVALAAASSSGLLSRLGGRGPGISVGTVLGDVVAVLLAVTLLGFAGLAYVAWVERAPKRRGPEPEVLEEEEPQRATSWSALLLPLLFLSVICLGLVLGWLFGGQGGTDATGRLPAPGAHPPARAPSGGDGGSWPVHWLVFAVLAGVGGVVAAVLLARDRLRRRRAEQSRAAAELVAAVDESLDDLEREADPRLAVIRAYGRMERTLALTGAGRRPPETPSEYLARALEAVRASRASIVRLTSLFQEAKFSRHAIDATMKAEAIDALGELRAELVSSEAVEAGR